MVNSIFPERIAQQDCPNAIKHLFDFLDEKARMHNITDPEIVHTWKNNSVVLRFWVNMLKNPHFLLDIDIAFPVESSLSTIAQVMQFEIIFWDSGVRKVPKFGNFRANLVEFRSFVIFWL